MKVISLLKFKQALGHKKLVFFAELDALRDHSHAVLTILNIATGPTFEVPLI